MATFPHAFQKLMLATGGFVETADTKTLDLTAAQLAVVSTATNKSVAIGAGTTYMNTPKVYLAQGSMDAVDNLGGRTSLGVGSARPTPFHGGYKESIKSREIDPRFISRFYYVGATDSTKASVKLSIVGTVAQFELNQSINGGPHVPSPGTLVQDGALRRQEVYRLRVDVKGSPVLRTLTHNLYMTFDATTKCMPDGSVDRADLIRQWAKGINAHPIVNQFVLATVPDEGVVNTLTDDLSLVLSDITAQTVFSDPTYSKNDYLEREGVQIFLSVYDERNVQCQTALFAITQLTDAKQGTGFGETILKQLILENEYQLRPHHTDLRLREVLGETSLTSINRTRKYGAYYLLHSIPRRYNNGTSQNADQTLIKIVTAPLAAGVMSGGTRNTPFENFILSYAASAGNNIDFENLTSKIAITY